MIYAQVDNLSGFEIPSPNMMSNSATRKGAPVCFHDFDLYVVSDHLPSLSLMAEPGSGYRGAWA